MLLGIGLTVSSLIQPSGLQIGEASWQPVFFGPIALVVASLLGVSYMVMKTASPLRALPATPNMHRRLRRRVATAGITLTLVGIAINVALFARWVSDGSVWSRSLALAGLAQALTLAGIIWTSASFLYWLLQRQTEYGAGRAMDLPVPTTVGS